MVNDIWETPGHVVGLQEAGTRLCSALQQPLKPKQGKQVRYTAKNTRKQAKDSPVQHMLVVRGREPGKTLAVAARDSCIKAVRRDCFVFRMLANTKLAQNTTTNGLMQETGSCFAPSNLECLTSMKAPTDPRST